MTAKDRFHSINYQERIVFILCCILFALGASIIARSDNVVNQIMLERTGIQPDAIGFFLWGMIPVSMVAYFLWRNLWSVLVAMSPVIAITFILAQYILTSPSAPLIHLVSFGWIPGSMLVLYYLSEENDEQSQIIRSLRAEIANKGG